MPYAEEKFRPRQSTRASRKATAAERQDFIFQALRDAHCTMTVSQVQGKVEDDNGLKFNEKETAAALGKLATNGKVEDVSLFGQKGHLWRTTPGAR
jgi:hypothetical protein